MRRAPGLLRRGVQSLLRVEAGFATPSWFRAAPRQRGGSQAEVLVLSPGAVPTTDLYLRSRMPAARIIDTLLTDPPEEPLPGAEVVLVRQAPRAWLEWLAARRDAFSRIALLMDDDMPCALAAPELPFGYASRTARRHRDVNRFLRGACDELWLSTPELLSRYPGPRSVLCAPLHVPGPAPVETAVEPVYFYHGTRAHLDEIRWLVGVVARVQERCPEAVFEVFGDAEVGRLFRGIPRVRLRPWLTWPRYLEYSAQHRFCVGLAPCLDTPFNRARAPVKFFDITRLRSAGVYADLAPYAGMVRHGETGLLCKEREGDWVDAITDLLSAPGRAAQMAQAALRACETHRVAHARWPSRQGAV